MSTDFIPKASPTPAEDFIPKQQTDFIPKGQAPHGGGMPPDRIQALVDKYAGENGLDPAIFRKLVQTESSFDPRARSSAGAQGLGQLMPATQKEYGVTDPYDPEQNLSAAARKLARDLKSHNGDWTKTLAAYNGGEGANQYAAKHGTYMGYGSPGNPNETHNYIQSILGDVPGLIKAENKVANKVVGKVKEAADFTRRHGGEAFFNGITYLARPSFAIETDMLNGKWADKQWSDDAMHAASHPKDYQKILDGLETAIFHDAGMLTNNQRLAGLKGEDLHGIAKFVTDFGVSVVADPTTYIPLADLFSWGARGSKLLAHSSASAGAIRTFAKALGPIGDTPAFKALTKAVDDWHTQAAVGVGKVKSGLDAITRRRPDLNNIAGAPGKPGISMTATGKLARMGIENVGNHTATVIRQENARVLKANAKELKGITYAEWAAGTKDLPLGVKRHSLMEVWKYGKDSDRAEAEAMLQKLNVPPTPAELRQYPKAMGLLDYEGKIQENYVSKVIPKSGENFAEGSQAAQDFFKMRSFAKEAHTPFVKPATWKVDPKLADFSVYDLMKNRWSLGAEATRKKMIAQKTADLYETHGRHMFEGDVELNAFDRDSRAAWFAKHVSDLPGSYSTGSMGKAARRLSDFWKIGIMGNFIPHGVINVGTVTMFRSNPWVAGRGFLYGVVGTPQKLDQALEQVGAKTSYWRQPDTMGMAHHIPGMGQWINTNQALLDRFETGYRASYLQFREKLDGALEKADPMNRMARGAQMDLDIGGYSHPMRFVSAIKALGGLYTTFRLDTVPRAALYAAMHHPGYLAIPGKEQQSFSNAFLSHSLEERNIGPYDDAAKATTDPIGYGTSPSTLGPVLGGLEGQLANRNSGYVPSAQEDERWVAGQVVPGLSSVFRALPGKKEAPKWMVDTGLAFDPTDEPQWVRFWNAVTGGYVTHKPTGKADKRRHKVFVRAENR